LEPLAQETAVVGDWTVALAVVPEGIDDVTAMPWPDPLGRPPVVGVGG
jgi:hypothetical protein